jgi:hypothetical protein
VAAWTGLLGAISTAEAAPLAAGGVPSGRKRQFRTDVGDFKHRSLCDVLGLDFSYLDPMVNFRGLPFWAGGMWSVQYDAKGNVYTVALGMDNDTAAPFMLQTNRGSDAIHLAKESVLAYNGLTQIDQKPNGVLWRSMDYSVRPEPMLKSESKATSTLA